MSFALIMLRRKLYPGMQHKIVRVLKRLLNELVKPSMHLPIDDNLDKQTLEAVRRFRWSKGLKPAAVAEVDVITWAAMGKALGKERLQQEVTKETDSELRALLLGVSQFAINKFYTPQMEECDKRIGAIFGGKNAIAAANGFEPEGLALRRSGYDRGDTLENGQVVPGHLAGTAMHLYASSDGTRFGVDGSLNTDIYIPNGFERLPQARSQTPSPTSARVDFYYKTLGKESNITLVVDHVADFRLRREGERWHIGKTGGKGGGEAPDYRHAHLELYTGDVGRAFVFDANGKFDKIATEAKRTKLRVPFARVFCS